MSSSSVWIRLYYEGKEEPEGKRPTSVKKPKDVEEGEWNVDALIKATKTELKPKIDYAPLDEIVVYPPGTTPPFSEGMAIDPGDDVPTGTKSRNPLIVVAPAQMQQVPSNIVSCRLWSNEGKHGVYRLPAGSCGQLKQEASAKFGLSKDASVNLYFLSNKDNILTRKKIEDESDLENFLQLAGNPAVLTWVRGTDDMSPQELPDEIVAPFPGSNASSLSTSTRGHMQRLFLQLAVLERDNEQCVMTRTKYKAGSGNVQAAHIIPVAAGRDVMKKAGLHNLYDTRNGMLLESRMHEAFDSYLWCMDENLKIVLSDAAGDQEKIKEIRLNKYKGNVLDFNIPTGEVPTKKDDAPFAQTLRVRYDIFCEKVNQRKQRGKRREVEEGTKMLDGNRTTNYPYP